MKYKNVDNDLDLISRYFSTGELPLAIMSKLRPDKDLGFVSIRKGRLERWGMYLKSLIRIASLIASLSYLVKIVLFLLLGGTQPFLLL